MDNLNYQYNLSGGRPVNNKLRFVTDAVPGNNFAEDIDNPEPDVVGDNYKYDAIGNLINEGHTSISWNVYGKISQITNSKQGYSLDYTFDASGNRIEKVFTLNGTTTYTWYVRDAQGNTLAVYEKQEAQAIALKETHLYGSSRLGLVNPVTKKTISLGGSLHAKVYTFTRGEKFFELTNHLGNVLAVITDKKLPVKTTTGNDISHWLAEVVSATSYYPFGMAMPGRTYSSGGYRYGFNGKENDNEVKGVGNQQDYGMRIYDPRLGRFLSVDPLTKNYPMLTPYQFASNRPIDGIDLDGLEYLPFHKSMYRLGYISNTREETMGNGTITKLTSNITVVNIVSENIPEGISDGKGGFTKVWGGPVSANGRDWDQSLDGPLVYDRSKYYTTPPAFSGKAESGKSFSGISSVKGNAVQSVNADKAGAAAGAAGPNGLGGMIKNKRVNNWIETLNGEKELRQGFYFATNMVNYNIAEGGFPNSLTALQTGQLINFMTDGHLFTDDISGSAYTLEGLTNALNIANLGVQALNQLGKLQPETTMNVSRLLQKYEALGGDLNNYRNLSAIVNPNTDKKDN
jgi:RHS repeat-associated protein